MSKRSIVFMGVLFVVMLGASVFAAELTLTGPQLKQGKPMDMEQVFSGMGCTGKNVSPALQWKGAPANTKSFAVTVYDPDAPTGSGWWHWIIFNIPAQVHALPKNAGDPASGAAPKGSIQSRTDFGKPGYGGPCPPPGDKPHRYVFTVYALDVEALPLDENATGAMVGFNLNSHALAKGKLTATFSR